MSKISIEGNVSGSGTLTIAAPNTNTNFTLTLPDSTGTVVLTQAAGGVATNTAVGTSALAANTTGANNTAVGYQALDANTEGQLNVAVGSGALGSNTTGTRNTAVGQSALFLNTTGQYNTAIGRAALETNSTASNNTAVGFEALNANTTGANNTAVGFGAGDAVTTGSGCVYLGKDAGGSATTAGDNTFVGNNVGSTTTTGSGNTYIGSNASGSAAGNNREIVIGFLVTGGGTNTVTLGSDAGLIRNSFTVNATWTQTSDERLKRNIQDDTLGLSFINRLRPVKYQWKPSNEIDPSLPYYKEENNRDIETVMHGLVAQEVKAALDAEGVTTFAGWDQGEDTIQAISREMFVSPLIKAIQELSAQVTALQAEVNTLKGQ